MSALESDIYFLKKDPQVIDSIESLLKLNIKKEYFDLGSTDNPNLFIPGTTPSLSNINVIQKPNYPVFGFETCGLFRGQVYNWPLIPKCYRDKEVFSKEDQGSIKARHGFFKSTFEFYDFCKKAKIQNFDFPDSLSDQMSIAQHFGVKTPLLDWSQNIFTAIFFAVREIFYNELFEKEYKVYIYHIKDERFLKEGIPKEDDLPNYYEASYLSPYPIDRRIERQKGVFTYHPFPGLQETLIPLDVYVIEDWQLMKYLREFLEGIGFTSDYFFPDYAGIAESVSIKHRL